MLEYGTLGDTGSGLARAATVNTGDRCRVSGEGVWVDVVRSRVSRGIVPVIMAVHFAVCLWLCNTLNVWIDESYAMQTTSRSLAYAVDQAIGFEEHPPFYFALLWLWRSINESVFWGRALSALSTLLFLAVVWRVVTIALPKIHPAWVVGPIAVNPIVLYAGSEMRAPAVVLLVSGLLVWLFIEGFLADSPRRYARAAYLVVSVIALYTYYYLGFMLLANGLVLLMTRRWRLIFVYYGMMAVVGLAFLPMVLTFPDQSRSFDSRTPFGLTFFGGVRLMIERIQAYVWPSRGLPLDGKLRWIVPGILGAGVSFTLFARRREIGRPLVLLLAMTAAVGMLLAMVAWQLGWRAMLDRHALLILLPSYLCLYGVISLWSDASRRKVLIAWTTIVALSTALALDSAFGRLAKSGDWNRITTLIEAHERPQEPILVFPSISAVPFSYHYKGINEVIAIPRPEEFLRYNYQEDSLQSEDEIVAALDRVPYVPESVWVVVNCDPESCGYLDVSYNLDILERYVVNTYTVDLAGYYFGSYVQHATRPARLADIEVTAPPGIEPAHLVQNP